ncbi:MAG: hypothetical protein ACJARD_001626 [Alphaproteobacteria bacterium]|jgi:hypothetical protein
MENYAYYDIILKINLNPTLVPLIGKPYHFTIHIKEAY